MSRSDDIAASNRRTTLRLAVAVVAMFGFGYLLVPLYDVFCQITGIGVDIEKTEAADVAGMTVDRERWVTVEFTGTVKAGLPWDFAPREPKLRVHPGQQVEFSFTTTNHSSSAVVGRAVPAVTPGRATRYFIKTECFCFRQQELGPGETKDMPLVFMVDRDLPPEVHTITLSYSFYRVEDPAPSGAGEGSSS
jgi:cytochrome c oxidase assembly protein subunit 11